MKEEKAELEVKFEHLLEKINSVKNNYQTVTKEVIRNVEKKNEVLKNQFGKLNTVAEEKENEFGYIMVLVIRIRLNWMKSKYMHS